MIQWGKSFGFYHRFYIFKIPDSLAQNPADLDSTDSEIEKKGMTFITIFDIHSSPLFLRGKRKGEKNNQSRGQKSFLSAQPDSDS